MSYRTQNALAVIAVVAVIVRNAAL